MILSNGSVNNTTQTPSFSDTEAFSLLDKLLIFDVFSLLSPAFSTIFAPSIRNETNITNLHPQSETKQT